MSVVQSGVAAAMSKCEEYEKAASEKRLLDGDELEAAFHSVVGLCAKVEACVGPVYDGASDVWCQIPMVRLRVWLCVLWFAHVTRLLRCCRCATVW